MLNVVSCKIVSYSYESFMKGCYLPNPAPAQTLVDGANRTVAFHDLMAEGEMIR